MSAERKLTVLLIEDEQSIIDESSASLCHFFSFIGINSQEDIISKARELQPVLIIIDMDHNDIDGFELCQQLKQQPTIASIPVMLLSKQDSIQDHLSGYESGAYDYLKAPLDELVVKNKLDLFRQHEEKASSLSQEAKMATDTALSAMVGNNELGQAIRFVEKSYAVDNFDELAEAFLSVTQALQLKCGFFIQSTTFSKCYGELTGLEQNLLKRMHGHENRFVDIKQKTLIFYPHISLLIKNMPLDDADRYGRIKDLLPSMLGAADARIVSLDTEAALTQQTADVSSTYDQVRDTLKDISIAFNENQEKTMSTLQGMLEELEFHIPGMGLEDDQETYLIQRVDLAVQEAEQAKDINENVSAAFHNISALLDHLSEQQHKILELVQSQKQQYSETAPDEDIELF